MTSFHIPGHFASLINFWPPAWWWQQKVPTSARLNPDHDELEIIVITTPPTLWFWFWFWFFLVSKMFLGTVSISRDRLGRLFTLFNSRRVHNQRTSGSGKLSKQSKDSWVRWRNQPTKKKTPQISRRLFDFFKKAFRQRNIRTAGPGYSKKSAGGWVWWKNRQFSRRVFDIIFRRESFPESSARMKGSCNLSPWLHSRAGYLIFTRCDDQLWYP